MLAPTLYAFDAGGQERAPLVLFLVSVVALSIVYTWLWLSTGGSLVVALLLHSAINVAADVLCAKGNPRIGSDLYLGGLKNGERSRCS